jgi:hypothetical protein
MNSAKMICKNDDAMRRIEDAGKKRDGHRKASSNGDTALSIAFKGHV